MPRMTRWPPATSEMLTQRELLTMLDELETLSCQLPTQWHRALARLQAETTPKELGAKSWKDVLRIRWRITATDANRRLAEAADLGPRRTLTGESLAPVLAATAAAQAAGLINSEHIDKIRDTMAHIPSFVDTPTREQIETDLVRLAVGVGPTELKKAADKVLFLLDQDGPEPDDAERARKRGLHFGPQKRDGTVDVKGTLTPEAWAIYEAIFAKTAAPGMCNPDDDQPCISGTPSQEQIDNDHRTLAQRQHDALIAIGRNALESGELGQHNGLPTSIIIRTTLQDLESRAGVGVTGGGTLMPIKDVIRLAGHANHWLAIFDQATGQALDLFRTKRVASPPNASCSSPATAAAPNPAAPCPPTAARSTTRCATGPTTATPTSTKSPWPAGRTTASSTKKAAGPPPSTPAATSNGSPRPHSTPAKPASTTTTAPNYSYAHRRGQSATLSGDLNEVGGRGEHFSPPPDL